MGPSCLYLAGVGVLTLSTRLKLALSLQLVSWDLHDAYNLKSIYRQQCFDSVLEGGVFTKVN
jgi:hypothetical protein